jgi:hypothetical protein
MMEAGGNRNEILIFAGRANGVAEDQVTSLGF